jgi:hypothetical protein
MASITTCPHCHMRVLPRPDGTCPSCNGLIQEAPAPVKRAAAAVVKPAPKSAERRKAGAKPARSAAPSAKEIEPVYRDYLQTANDIWRETLGAFYPYLIAGIVVCLALIAVSFATWEPNLNNVDPMVRVPNSLTWVLIWAGVAALLILIVIGAFVGERRANADVRGLAQDKQGLPDFYRAFIRRYWPKEGMVSGPALDKFLTMIGKK